MNKFPQQAAGRYAHSYSGRVLGEQPRLTSPLRVAKVLFMRRSRWFLSTAALVAALTTMACPGKPEEPTSSPTSAALVSRPTLRPVVPTPLPGIPTPWPSTGIEEVDAVVAAVLARDAEALAARVAYTAVTCAATSGVGSPPLCSQLGVPIGTLLEALRAAVCEGFFVPKTDVLRFLDGALGGKGDVLRPFGAFVPAGAKGGVGPKPDYVVLFRPIGERERLGYRALHLKDRQIVFAQTGCAGQVPYVDEVERWLVPLGNY